MSVRVEKLFLLLVLLLLLKVLRMGRLDALWDSDPSILCIDP